MIDTKRIIDLGKELHSANANWRSYWQDLADFCLPRKAWINTIKSKGEALKFNFLYDTTAIRALPIMAAGFHSNLTNPSSKWFNLETENPILMRQKDVQTWFNDVETILLSILNGSNFDTVMQEFYVDYGCFGTSDIFVEPDPKEKVRFTCIPIESLDLVEDARGRISEVFRHFPLTAKQAFGEWGSRAGKTVLELYKDKPETKLDFIHYVGPRDERNLNFEDNLNMPLTSAWINIKDELTMDEKGFKEMPHMVGRFYKHSGDVFGYSPAMNALADIKGVNFQKRTNIRAGAKATDPAHLIPSKGFVLPLNLNPGASNYYDASKGNADMVKSIRHEGSVQLGVELLKMDQECVDKHFFVPLFQSLSDIHKTMTVPEVNRRIAENMVLLGPVVGRCTQEVLNPLIIRVFNIAHRAGLLPDIPESISGVNFRITYLSPLAKAQRTSEMNSLQTGLFTLSEVAKVKPDVLDILDEDKIAHKVWDIQGIDPNLLREDKDVQAIRKARQQMQMQQAQLEAAKMGADAAKSGASASKSMADAHQASQPAQ